MAPLGSQINIKIKIIFIQLLPQLWEEQYKGYNEE